jgi:serine/threonine protein kinase
MEEYTLEDFELGNRLSQGACGEVRIAWRKSDDLPVALKTLFLDTNVSAENRDEFLQEVEVMSSFGRHPNLVHFLGAKMTPPSMFIVMELCESSLHHLLHEAQPCPLSLSDKLVALGDVASGLDQMHSLNMIHRDVKTLNILRGYDGSFKLCDFGLVRSDRVGAGTVSYMSPESLLKRSLSRKVDIFALGYVIYELVTLSLPFFGIDPQDVRDLVIGGTTPRFHRDPHVPPGLYDLMERCWQYEPEDRPEAGTVAVEVEALLREEASMRQEREERAVKEPDALDMLMGK